MDAEAYLRTDLQSLLDVLRASDVRELEVQDGDLSVRLRRADITEVQWESVETERLELAVEETPQILSVVAPLVGTFYSAGKPGMSPLVVEGSQVEEDTVVGIIEALHVLTDVTAGVRGKVVKVLVSDGHAVEYGQPLVDVLLDG